MPDPVDQSVRDRFIQDIDRNFSLIAPAGTGKTNSIAERVLTIARNRPESLRNLVVVTYTNKAAEEMRLRVRTRAVERDLGVGMTTALGEVFFGTIHAFCSRLLHAVGDRIGLRPGFEHLQNPQEAWGEFLSTDIVKAFFAEREAEFREICRFIPMESLLDRLSDGRVIAGQDEKIALPSPPDWNLLLDEELLLAARKNSRPKIEANQSIARRWGEAHESGSGFIPVPKCDGGGAAFQQLWKDVFGGFYSGLEQVADQLLAELSQAFADWRTEQGVLSFDDQLRLARKLFEDPLAREWILGREYAIILDEAQDTDPVQFDVLLQAAGSRDPKKEAPPGGRFAMVGDPQQSIYGNRADLGRYLACTKLLGSDAELSLSVTFRCSREVIRSVNAVGPTLLDGNGEQASFVKLRARAEAPQGGVQRLLLEHGETEAPDEFEAVALAEWLAMQSPTALGARGWGQVAIILPRKAGLRPFADALRRQDLQVQLHSETQVNHDAPAYAWLTALLTIMAEPDNAWELYGFLREAFGVSDSRLVAETNLRIDQTPRQGGAVESELRLLAEARAAAQGLPLRDAVERIANQIDLRGRLESLPDYDPDESIGELDRLLAVAGDAEAQRLTVGAWAEQLRLGLEDTRPGKEADPNAVQLIGGHKSKGSEWDVVIVPSLSRPIRFSSKSDKFFANYAEDDEKEQRARRRRAETERLLYVTLTRARERLILVDDRRLRSRSSGVLFSYTDLLGEEWIDALPLVERSRQMRLDIEPDPGTKPVPAPRPKPLPISAAVTNARRFLTRQLPHELAHPSDPSESPDRERIRELEIPLDNPGIRYGTWWHDTMERMPWGRGVEACRAVAEAHLPECPMPARGTDETDRLLDSRLGAWLASGRFIAHREIAFLRSTDAMTVMQGVIDLAILIDDEWLILDWKTDRVARIDQLSDQYAPQILAYADAVKTTTGLPCTGGIWSTAHGEWLNLEGNCRHF